MAEAARQKKMPADSCISCARLAGVSGAGHGAARWRRGGAAGGPHRGGEEERELELADAGVLGVDVKVILTRSCIFRMENH